MQQRRLRLGDILDDYCPRERRITNHAVVAMIDDEVKQTRCTTCDADHEYKEARVPVLRRKKAAAGSMADGEVPRPTFVPAPRAFDSAEQPMLASPDVEPDLQESESDHESVTETVPDRPSDDEGPVHRPLIRATLPRPEGQVPERKAPEFTMRQPGTRGREGGGGAKRLRQRGRRQQAQGQGGPFTRFGGPGQPQGQRHGGGRARPAQGQRGDRPSGNGRGQRTGSGPGSGRGPKRGR